PLAVLTSDLFSVGGQVISRPTVTKEKSRPLDDFFLWSSRSDYA
ncbi:MAG: hypothetical protein ACI9T8_000130, partial [Candidatus Saccharimonadales bacterium]